MHWTRLCCLISKNCYSLDKDIHLHKGCRLYSPYLFPNNIFSGARDVGRFLLFRIRPPWYVWIFGLVRDGILRRLVGEMDIRYGLTNSGGQGGRRAIVWEEISRWKRGWYRLDRVESIWRACMLRRIRWIGLYLMMYVCILMFGFQVFSFSWHRIGAWQVCPVRTQKDTFLIAQLSLCVASSCHQPAANCCWYLELLIEDAGGCFPSLRATHKYELERA